MKYVLTIAVVALSGGVFAAQNPNPKAAGDLSAANKVLQKKPSVTLGGPGPSGQPSAQQQVQQKSNPEILNRPPINGSAAVQNNGATGNSNDGAARFGKWLDDYLRAKETSVYKYINELFPGAPNDSDSDSEDDDAIKATPKQ